MDDDAGQYRNIKRVHPKRDDPPVTTYSQLVYAVKLHQRMEKYKRLGFDVSLVDPDHIEKTLEWLDEHIRRTDASQGTDVEG